MNLLHFILSPTILDIYIRLELNTARKQQRTPSPSLKTRRQQPYKRATTAIVSYLFSFILDGSSVSIFFIVRIAISAVLIATGATIRPRTTAQLSINQFNQK
jgi:hypothetical protein